MARWCPHRWHRTWQPVSWPAVLFYLLGTTGETGDPNWDHSPKTECTRPLYNSMCWNWGLWLQHSSLWKSPTFEFLLGPAKRWHLQPDSMPTLHYDNGPGLGVGRGGHAPQTLQDIGDHLALCKKWRSENHWKLILQKETLLNTFKVQVSTMVVKMSQVEWGILCKNGRFAAWPRRKINHKFAWKISLQCLCLIADRFLLEQQQSWESQMPPQSTLLGNKGITWCHKEVLNNYMQPCLLGNSTRRIKVLRGVLGAHLLNLTHWKPRANVVMIYKRHLRACTISFGNTRKHRVKHEFSST